MIKINVEQGSEAWFQERCGRITATRFKQLISGQSTKGYKDLILDVAGEIITGEPEETYSNEAMERGKELESEAARMYEDIYGVQLEHTGLVIPDEGTPYHDYIGISPDGLLDGSGLEIKCPYRKTHLMYLEAGKLPSEYKAQVQAQLFVTGFKTWDFMSYYPNMKPFIITVEPDMELHKLFEERLNTVISEIKKVIDKYHKYDYEPE